MTEKRATVRLLAEVLEHAERCRKRLGLRSLNEYIVRTVENENQAEDEHLESRAAVNRKLRLITGIALPSAASDDLARPRRWGAERFRGSRIG